MAMAENKILVGNVFPMALIRRNCRIQMSLLANLKDKMEEGAGVVSFWGHTNTLAAVNAAVGVDLTPKTERPALVLSAAGYPVLDGEEFRDVWVVSPDYRPGFRPAIGVEVQPEDILGWQVLRIFFD